MTIINRLSIILIIILIIIISKSSNAQHQELNEKPNTWPSGNETKTDSSSLLYAFKNGVFNGHFRYFFMATNNKTPLTDYYANAAGGGIRYETSKFYGFQFALSGFYIFNIGSSNLAVADSSTGLFNRYEIALFDIQNPNNKTDINRLEELYLKYNYKKSFIKIGRQLINTPFINLQDGRMRPTEVSGAYIEFNQLKSLKIESAWIKSISPRSTIKWYNIDESIGIYSSGNNIDGSKSQYFNNLKSAGVFIVGLKSPISKFINLNFWNTLTENIFNTAMLQADYISGSNKNYSFFTSLQLIKQDAINNGGNLDPTKSYFQKKGKSLIIGAKIGFKNKRSETSLNYNRITADGRYLMPREWGREPFFTFLPRERNEGLGDVHAIVVKTNYKIIKAGINSSLAIGYYRLPDIKNFFLNKYGMPSYNQINADIKYSFKGSLKGIESQLLFVYKVNSGNTYNSNKYKFNRVDMMNLSLVLNYYF